MMPQTTETAPRAPLRLGDAAPNFKARSTKGPLSLSDFRGRWLVLFTHPADFTPVCTSEFVAFARAARHFAELDCALLGLSVDSLFSHLAWIRLIHDRFGVTVDFPIVEDPTLEIAKAYGMVGPDAVDASTVRTTLFLDPDGVLRASTSYPAEVGRSIPEVLRMLQALRRVQQGGVLTPADWQPGADLLREPAQDAGDLLSGGAADWFYATVEDGEAT
jgi:peroxiredoxin 2/4